MGSDLHYVLCHLKLLDDFALSLALNPDYIHLISLHSIANNELLRIDQSPNIY